MRPLTSAEGHRDEPLKDQFESDWLPRLRVFETVSADPNRLANDASEKADAKSADK